MASATTSSCVQRKAMTTHPQFAPTMVSKELVTLIRTPMSAPPPMSVPMARMSVGQLIRRGSASLGTSIDAASAASERISSRSAVLPRRARASTGSSPARRRCSRTLVSRSAGRHRAADAEACSGPAARPSAATAPARSRSRRSGPALEVALRKSRSPVAPEPGSTMMVSPLTAPWAIRSDRSVRNWPITLSSMASESASLSRSERRVPPGTRQTRTASLEIPELPAATTSGTLTSTRWASSVRYASCSTCWRRVKVRVGPESR